MYIHNTLTSSTMYRSVFYHASNSRKCMGVNGEALQLHAVYKKPYFLLQVTRESVSGTTSHVRTSECAMKSKVKIIVQSYTGKNITRLLPLVL